MTHVAILQQIYGELVNEPKFPQTTESLGGRPVFGKIIFDSESIIDGLQASIEFGIHHEEAIFTHSASLRLFESMSLGSDPVTYLELQAFDVSNRFSLGGITVFIGLGKDEVKANQCQLVIKRAQSLKQAAILSRLLGLIKFRQNFALAA